LKNDYGKSRPVDDRQRCRLRIGCTCKSIDKKRRRILCTLRMRETDRRTHRERERVRSRRRRVCSRLCVRDCVRMRNTLSGCDDDGIVRKCGNSGKSVRRLENELQSILHNRCKQAERPTQQKLRQRWCRRPRKVPPPAKRRFDPINYCQIGRLPIVLGSVSAAYDQLQLKPNLV
ncbi:hypothetical protein M514_07345, partial [Trichuris suis]